MTSEEEEQVWVEVEQVGFEAICAIAKLLKQLNHVEQAQIYARLDAIAIDGMSQLGKIRKMH